jgi:menaquinone-dependent protoporphyrinogen oxidase
MSRFLVAYAGTHGQTARIARRIAEVLRAQGHQAQLRDAASAPDPTGYDAVLVGASIRRGRYAPELVGWLQRHAFALNTMPSAFFSVCLSVLEDRDAAGTFIDALEEDTGWTPRYRTTFAGALRYPAYDAFTRLLMRVLMHRGGHPTDIRREYEYTDWDAVDAFARDCAGLPARALA